MKLTKAAIFASLARGPARMLAAPKRKHPKLPGRQLESPECQRARVSFNRARRHSQRVATVELIAEFGRGYYPDTLVDAAQEWCDRNA